MQAWQKKFSFPSCLQLPGDGGQLNKDSISLLPDRQLRKYLQPHCNAAKWTLEDKHKQKPKNIILTKIQSVFSNLTMHISYIIPACVCYV